MTVSKKESGLTRIIVAACLLVAAGASARAQDAAAAEEKRQNIKRLLQLTKAGEVGVQFLQLTLPQMRGLYSAVLEGLPAVKRERAVKILEEELFRVFTAERVVEELVPIYDRHFTGEEIEDLIAFYESAAGKKFVAMQPQIITEANGVGQRVALEAIQAIQKKMDAEGIKLPPPPAPSRVRPTRRRP